MATMKAAVFERAGRIVLREKPVPTVGPTDALIRVLTAAGLYDETPESVAAREQRALERRLARPLGADLGGRPTKQDRRRLDALRRAKRER